MKIRILLSALVFAVTLMSQICFASQYGSESDTKMPVLKPDQDIDLGVPASTPPISSWVIISEDSIITVTTFDENGNMISIDTGLEAIENLLNITGGAE